MKKLILLLIFFGAIILAPRVLAATTSDGAFSLNYASPLFDVQNAAPGGEYAAPITVTNNSNDTQDLQLQLNITADPKTLADSLDLSVADGNGNCLWGCGNDQKISALDNSEITFSNIPGGATKNYELVLLFSSEAGNDLQNATMAFDLALGFPGSVPSGPSHHSSHHSSDNDHNSGPHASTTHVLGAAIGLGSNAGPTGKPLVLGGTVNENPTDNNSGNSDGNVAHAAGPGEIQGVSVSQCHGWPEWAWVLALIIFFLIFSEDLRRKYKKEKVGWKSPLLWIVTAIAFWYIFDVCQAARWFLYCVIIFGILGYSAYLEAIRRRMKLENPGVESEPDPFLEDKE
ncbi:MAG: hypothetical protein P4L62_03220 [Candidatus Pacebacteria bacterium]|nr:hypothetical protein [Candidatus Paceibacterota bacterium]MDR3583342.1 hypothetical protein [Candidatus Paceibacterota bacterium]